MSSFFSMNCKNPLFFFVLIIVTLVFLKIFIQLDVPNKIDDKVGILTNESIKHSFYSLKNLNESCLERENPVLDTSDLCYVIHLSTHNKYAVKYHLPEKVLRIAQNPKLLEVRNLSDNYEKQRLSGVSPEKLKILKEEIDKLFESFSENYEEAFKNAMQDRKNEINENAHFKSIILRTTFLVLIFVLILFGIFSFTKKDEKSKLILGQFLIYVPILIILYFNDLNPFLNSIHFNQIGFESLSPLLGAWIIGIVGMFPLIWVFGKFLSQSTKKIGSKILIINNLIFIAFIIGNYVRVSNMTSEGYEYLLIIPLTIIWYLISLVSSVIYLRKVLKQEYEEGEGEE